VLVIFFIILFSIFEESNDFTFDLRLAKS